MLRMLSGIAVIIAACWTWKEPGFESFSALFGALVAFVSALAIPVIKARRQSIKQTVGKGAIGIQAGRDARVKLGGRSGYDKSEK
jgi:hypothetical protein